VFVDIYVAYYIYKLSASRRWRCAQAIASSTDNAIRQLNPDTGATIVSTWIGEQTRADGALVDAVAQLEIDSATHN
jgi:hypothetical protein